MALKLSGMGFISKIKILLGLFQQVLHFWIINKKKKDRKARKFRR